MSGLLSWNVRISEIFESCVMAAAELRPRLQVGALCCELTCKPLKQFLLRRSISHGWACTRREQSPESLELSDKSQFMLYKHVLAGEDLAMLQWKGT